MLFVTCLSEQLVGQLSNRDGSGLVESGLARYCMQHRQMYNVRHNIPDLDRVQLEQFSSYPTEPLDALVPLIL
jgi:hypothetical protein